MTNTGCLCECVYFEHKSKMYNSIGKLYYRNAAVAIVCFDLKNADSFNAIPYWIKEVKKVTETAKIYICACKADLLRNSEEKVNKYFGANEINEVAEQFNAKFIETSAKTGQNVKELFEYMNYI